MSVAAKNNRMVNLILKYMSMIDYAAVPMIKSIMMDLLNYQAFDEYLIECPF